MNFIKRYINYLKDNPENYWFKRKIFGWGWVPVKWEGWLVLLIFILLLIWNAFTIGENPTDNELSWFFVKIIISAAAVIFICYKKGEKPRWQWGLPDKDTDGNPK